MKASITKNKYFYTFLGVLFFFLLWFAIAEIVGEKTLVFPSPIETFSYLGDLLSISYLYRCIGATFLKMLSGFLIALLLAFLLGLLSGHFENFSLVLGPTISVIKAIPSAVIVFLFMVLAGVKNTPSIMVIVIAFPILYESISGGVKSIDENLIKASRLDGARRLKRLWRITLPEIFPYFVVGVSSSFSLSFKIEIMAEIICGDTGIGLGAAILYAQRNNPADMRPVFAYSFVAVVFIFIVSLLLKAIENAYKKKIS